MPTNMWATPTTTPRYFLMEEQLQKETWTPYTWSFANSKCGEGIWVPQVRSSHSNSLYWFGNGVGSCSLLHKKRRKKTRGIVMVTTLSLHQQDTMVSTLNVLLLTLNKALPGGRPRITGFVLILILWIMLDHASCFLYLSLFALVWMCV